jgi:hypothetical protein
LHTAADFLSRNIENAHRRNGQRLLVSRFNYHMSLFALRIHDEFFEVEGVPVAYIPSANRFNRQMKTRVLLILLALVATLPAAPTKTEVSYRFSVEKGAVTLADAKSGAVLATTTIERWGRPASTQDQLRHVALDVTAAVVAGNGGREHTVDPNSPVHTMEEAAKARAVTATFEGDFFFAIRRDSSRNGRYEALIIRGDASSTRVIH